jgi:hypothetical protein
MRPAIGGVPSANIPDADHVLRHVPKRAIEWDPDDLDRAVGVLYLAFELRPGENSLSCGWVEHPAHKGGFDEKVKATKLAFQSALKLRKSHRFALGNVGNIKKACLDHGVKVRVLHEPEPDFDCHASIRQFQDHNRALLDLLASEAWAEMLEIA